jgi:hypothetical protein
MGEQSVLTNVGFGRIKIQDALDIFMQLSPRRKGQINDAI